MELLKTNQHFADIIDRIIFHQLHKTETGYDKEEGPFSELNLHSRRSLIIVLNPDWILFVELNWRSDQHVHLPELAMSATGSHIPAQGFRFHRPIHSR